MRDNVHYKLHAILSVGDVEGLVLDSLILELSIMYPITRYHVAPGIQVSGNSILQDPPWYTTQVYH